eukprot:scaffold1420_cov375-Pavlova_lutheri.AAC.40
MENPPWDRILHGWIDTLIASSNKCTLMSTCKWGAHVPRPGWNASNAASTVSEYASSTLHSRSNGI